MNLIHASPRPVFLKSILKLPLLCYRQNHKQNWRTLRRAPSGVCVRTSFGGYMLRFPGLRDAIYYTQTARKSGSHADISSRLTPRASTTQHISMHASGDCVPSTNARRHWSTVQVRIPGQSLLSAGSGCSLRLPVRQFLPERPMPARESFPAHSNQRESGFCQGKWIMRQKPQHRL